MDWLGDIGGLAGSLYAIFGAVVIVFQYKVAYFYVAQQTYMIRENEEKLVSRTHKAEELKQIPINSLGSIKLSF